MTGHAVVIAGGGPTGLMLAGELALAKVDVAIVERRARTSPARAQAVCAHAPSRFSISVEFFGCDGGRSLIRKAAGIEFPGWDPTTSCLIAEDEMGEEPEWGLRRDALGIHSLSSMGDGGPVRRCDNL